MELNIKTNLEKKQNTNKDKHSKSKTNKDSKKDLNNKSSKTKNESDEKIIKSHKKKSKKDLKKNIQTEITSSSNSLSKSEIEQTNILKIMTDFGQSILNKNILEQKPTQSIETNFFKKILVGKNTIDNDDNDNMNDNSKDVLNVNGNSNINGDCFIDGNLYLNNNFMASNAFFSNNIFINNSLNLQSEKISTNILTNNYGNSNQISEEFYNFILQNMCTTIKNIELSNVNFSSIKFFSEKNKYIIPSIINVNKKITILDDIFLGTGLFYIISIKKKIIVAKHIHDTFIILNKKYEPVSINKNIQQQSLPEFEKLNMFLKNTMDIMNIQNNNNSDINLYYSKANKNEYSVIGNKDINKDINKDKNKDENNDKNKDENNDKNKDENKDEDDNENKDEYENENKDEYENENKDENDEDENDEDENDEDENDEDENDEDENDEDENDEDENDEDDDDEDELISNIKSELEDNKINNESINFNEYLLNIMTSSIDENSINSILQKLSSNDSKKK